jgi:hypothetical protein
MLNVDEGDRLQLPTAFPVEALEGEREDFNETYIQYSVTE